MHPRILPILSISVRGIHHVRMSENAKRRPGDYLLDRYFKEADEATRERARDAFREYARVLEALGDKIAARNRDSRESDSSDTIPPTSSSA